MLNFEVGYTPTNLRLVIEKLGVTQAALARILGVTPQAVRSWLMPVGTKSRRDMSHEKWLEVMALLDKGIYLHPALIAAWCHQSMCDDDY